MQDLLARAIHAHGGVEHWRTLSRFRARSHVKGAIWAVKGKQGAFGELVITGGTRTQRVTIAPYPDLGAASRGNHSARPSSRTTASW
jgi:hypothetical protein